jgi:hypothetical protein
MIFSRIKQVSLLLYKETADLNYDLSSIEWRQVEKTSHSRLPGIVQGFLRFFLKLFSSIKYCRYPRSKAEILFLIGSDNNFKSLSPVFNGTKNAGLIGYNGQVSYRSHIPEFYFYFYALFSIPRFFLAYFACPDKYVRWTMRRRLDRYLLAFSSVSQWTRILSKTCCRVLVVSNDHVVWARSALKAARNLGIQTVFIPHAPTGQYPPKMEFDYALLDGKAQFYTYLKAGIGSTKCFITGAIRYEDLVLLSDAEGYGILVCFNPIDSSEFIRKFLSSLQSENIRRPVYVRPHPSDTRRFELIEALCSEFGLEFCSPQEPILNQLQKVDTVLAGVSGVHVDAIMAGRRAFTVNEWYFGDYYGLKEMGLLKVISALTDIRSIDGNKYYSASAKTKMENLNWHKSDLNLLPSQSAAQLLNDISSGSITQSEQIIKCLKVDFCFDETNEAYFSYGTGSHEKHF